MKAGTLTLVLVNLAGIMERADESLLPGVYKEVGEALHSGSTGLGFLTLFRSMVFDEFLADLLLNYLSLEDYIGLATEFHTYSESFDIVFVNASLNFFCDEFESVDDVKMIACVSMLQSPSWQSEEIKSCKKRFETEGLVPVYQL
ncbi:hypothetical protein SASPL_106455 [Salvia splendens]|uniref:Uncharacterized protein n=1 Tax=Salvia splendens TaxID=180675 RepID=A0A8X8YQP0_SALSN|nr:hypothetical protein SASPL_106455 [Salvia splendens]